MKRSDLFLFVSGFAVGLALAYGLLSQWQSNQAVSMRDAISHRNTPMRLTQDAILLQNGQPVGRLTQGARLWTDSGDEAPKQTQLLVEWNDDGHFQARFIPAATDGAPAELKGFTTLEPVQ